MGLEKSLLVEENLKLSFIQWAFEDPAYLEEIPEEADVIVLPLDNMERDQEVITQRFAKAAGKSQV